MTVLRVRMIRQRPLQRSGMRLMLNIWKPDEKLSQDVAQQ
jgi:hypothetical protein